MMNKSILGISAFYHDSAAALIRDGEIIAAAQEERFTRVKHDPSFPINAVEYVIEEAGLDPKDISLVVFYDKPLIKFERLLETYHAFIPSGFRSFSKAIPVWIKEKLFLKNQLRKDLKELGLINFELKFPEHHLSHAASAFFPSPFEEAAILTVDGVGEWATTCIFQAKGNKIKLLREIDFPHSLGLLYSSFTYFLGFKVNSGEYKLMGLAPYGRSGSPEVEKYKETIYEELIDLKDDGSFVLNMKYFNYATGLTMVKEKAWERIFGMAKRSGESDFDQSNMDLALAIQEVTEDAVLKLAQTAMKLAGTRNLCLAGGVALNCVANGKIERMEGCDSLWIQPAAGDAGGALGAALAVYYLEGNQDRIIPDKKDFMSGSYLGPSYDLKHVAALTEKYQAAFTTYREFDEVAKHTAEFISKGKVIGWFQGRMEFGPRALGNRSIVGDPRDPEMQKKLNLKIKYRESFRPFAPSVLEERAKEYFKIKKESPYMLLVAPVEDKWRKEEPKGYSNFEIREKLYHLRSELPAITHVDYSARVQSVSKETNLEYWELINAVGQITGTPMIVNTSFNVRGEPIVCTPEDAYRCFMRTEMDVLVVNNSIFIKEEQKDWKETDSWKETFTLD